MNTNQKTYKYLGPTLEDSNRYYAGVSITLGIAGVAMNSPALIIGWALSAFPAIGTNQKKEERKDRIAVIDFHPEKYPLENVDSISINDFEGLDMLLEKTSKNKGVREWGTYFEAGYNQEKNSADIEKILSFEESKQLGVINHIARVDIKSLEEYGIQHYHPKRFSNSLGAWNYGVHNGDRMNSALNTINLLTFNLKSGPEIIGFNTKYTYIPADSSKSILVKANHEGIMEYLKNDPHYFRMNLSRGS